MNYDEAIQQAEQLVKDLERAQVLTMDVYKQKSAEVKRLLDFCERKLTALEKDLLV